MGRKGRITWAQRILAALLALQMVFGTVPPVVRAELEGASAVAPVSFVLDQGLPLELTFDDVFGADVLSGDVQILGMADEGQVPGDDPEALELLEGWTIDGAQGYQGQIRVWPRARGAEPFLRYTPVDFLSGRDVIHILLQVPGADGQPELMVKTVTFLPGNVVYYEEDFPGVEVIGGSFKTTDEDGRCQSADQSMPHGYDPAYATTEDVSMSGGSFATVPIAPPPDGQLYEAKPAVRFTFTGTGFEVVTMTDSLFATALEVEIFRSTEDGQELVQKYPLITSYSDRLGGSGSGVVIYQVPMIRILGMDYGTYTVQISGVPLVVGHDKDGGPIYGPTTYIYVDGVRIFQPLADATEQEYGNEFGAVFTEPRALVLEGKAAVLGLENDSQSRVGLVGLTGSGITFHEDVGRGWIESGLGGDMKCVEPSNEVYLGGVTGGNAMVLYVSEAEAGEGMLQIGLRDMHEDLYRGLHGSDNQSSSFHYLLADGSWSQKVQVGRCGTEQYHAIDYRACPTVVHGGAVYHQVLIRVSSGMLSLTGIKSAGLGFAELFTDREQNRYRYDGYGLYQAARLAEDGSELPQNEAVWQGAPQDPRCRYRTEDGCLSYAWRYDLQGKELPEDGLVWISDGVMPGYHYKLDDGRLLRSARFDAYGNEIRADDLSWHTVDSPVTGSLFRCGSALIAAAEAERETEVPEAPVEPEEPHVGNWWQRFVIWLKELFQVMFSGL